MSYFGVGFKAAHIMIACSRHLVHWTADPEPLYKAGGHPGGLDKLYARKVAMVYCPKNDTFHPFYNAVPGRKGVITEGRGIGLLASKPLAEDSGSHEIKTPGKPRRVFSQIPRSSRAQHARLTALCIYALTGPMPPPDLPGRPVECPCRIACSTRLAFPRN
jgi:hypothetical protein